MDELDERSRQLTEVNEALIAKQREYNELNGRLTELTGTYKTKSDTYSEELAQLTKQVRQLRQQAAMYEEGMRITREADGDRALKLDEHEQDLKGRERRLAQDNADFEHRKKQFRQLQEISSGR